jgi:hypothetical protein
MKHTILIAHGLISPRFMVVSSIFLASLTGLFYSNKIFYYVFFDLRKGSKSAYGLPMLGSSLPYYAG